MKALYDQMVDLMTHAQFVQIMGGDMSYVSKAKRAKAVSKSKKINALADQIITLSSPLTLVK